MKLGISSCSDIIELTLARGLTVEVTASRSSAARPIAWDAPCFHRERARSCSRSAALLPA